MLAAKQSSYVNKLPLSFRLLRRVPFTRRGFLHYRSWKSSSGEKTSYFASKIEYTKNSNNPLKAYFDSHKTGRGIWKWYHYFDIYHRHLHKFVGAEVNILEIGVYSGGSLEMWRNYFGSHCSIFGVDIEESCKVYENKWTRIFVGDQADRNFWKTFIEQVPGIDILIDDGGQKIDDRIILLEEMLPHLRPGGVYIRESIHGDLNKFNSYIYGLAANLNAFETVSGDLENGLTYSPTDFQTMIHSVHLYPFVTVIEESEKLLDQFSAPKHGTHWQPFYNDVK